MQLYQKDTILLDRYQIERPLGVGGQAVVYLATHLGLGRQVAIKTIRLDQPEHMRHKLQQRFEREARLLAQLNDPHTITLHDFGHTPEGQLFMVFEYIDGQTLKDRLNDGGPISPAQCVSILEQILQAIGEAHQKGALHRDLKPANIMLHTVNGLPDQVKVLDFGVAKIMLEGVQLTGAGNFVGTPRYLAPEALRNETPTPAYDIYSVGLLAYNMLTGTHPMAKKTVREVFDMLMSEENFTIPHEIGVSKALTTIVERMLKKSIEARYQNAQDIIRDLKALPPQQDFPLARRPDHTPSFAQTQKMHAIGQPLGNVISEAEQTNVFDIDTQRGPISAPLINPLAAVEPPSPATPPVEEASSSIEAAPFGFVRRVPDRIKQRSEQLSETSLVEDEGASVLGQSATFTREHQAVKPMTKKIVVDDLPFEQQQKEIQIGKLANIRPTVQRTAGELTSKIQSVAPPTAQAHQMGAALGQQHAPEPQGIPTIYKVGLAVILLIFGLAIVVMIIAISHI